MTQDDIIEIAREAGFTQYLGVVAVPDMQSLNRFVAIVSGKEREACANLVFHSPPSDEYESPLTAVYNAILARGNK